MVDKKVAFNRDVRSEEFAENDPLAELARIVGYEDRPRHVSPPAAPAAGAQQRRDPSFNLEDELLREFAIYDAPREEARLAANDTANPAVESIHANDFLQRVEDVFARREPELEPAPQADSVYHDNYALTEAPIGDALRYTMNAQPQDFGSDTYAQPQEPQAPSYQRPVYDEPAYNEPAYNEPVYQAPAHHEPVYEEPVYVEAVSQEPVYQAPIYAEPIYEEPAYEAAADLSYEVEQSVADGPSYQPEASYQPETSYQAELVYAPEPTPAQVAPRTSQSARSSLEFSSMRQPLGNFSMSRATPFIPKAASAPGFASPVPTATPVPSHFEAPIAAPAAPTFDAQSDLDALIADVSRYSIGTAERQAPAPSIAVKADFAPVARQPIVAAAPADPAFDLQDDDFEAALDDLDFDFDLSDIDLSEGPKPAVAATPVPAQPQPQPIAAPVYAPVAAPAPTYVAPVERAPEPQPRAQPAVTSFDPLPFDLDQIGDTEYHPETISDFDVPELPPLAIEPKSVVHRQDGDLDLDTELAALFTPSSTGLERHRGAAPQQPAPRASDVDEFERALEEDFRRSLQENPTKPNKIQANTADRHGDYSVDDERYGEPRSMKGWIMPAIAIVGALVVVGGVYSAFFTGSTTGSDGLPVVIAADNEPMKVVPADPGGRVVPNQDKAVYDRVAGNASTDPKQPALISSDEKPVDVVQHTLIPEQVTVDDDGDFGGEAISGAEALDTVDPRLLPNGENEAANSSAPVEAPVNVAPRRVRTMIVKPDGTLVTQEVDAPTAPARVAQVAAPAQVPAAVQQTQAQTKVSTPAPTPTPVAPKPVAAAPAPVIAEAPAPAPAPVQAQAPVATAPVAPAATNTASSGGFYIQIASLPSDAEAQKTYKSMSSKFGSVIGGRGVDIKRADIAGKGTYFRVRIPAGDRGEANALCQRFQSAGGSCLVTR